MKAGGAVEPSSSARGGSCSRKQPERHYNSTRLPIWRPYDKARRSVSHSYAGRRRFSATK
jgi:hypothetical protein